MVACGGQQSIASRSSESARPLLCFVLFFLFIGVGKASLFIFYFLSNVRINEICSELACVLERVFVLQRRTRAPTKRAGKYR